MSRGYGHRGEPEAARERLDTALALAQDTGMCVYDAELLLPAASPLSVDAPNLAAGFA